MKNAYLLGLFALIVLGGCASIEDEVKTPARTNVSFTSSDGEEIDAFLAVPDGAGTFPAVLMVHEWWGLNQDVVIMAEALAAVITLYGSGLVTEPESLGNLADNAPVLGIFGEDDNSIPLRNVRAFESALDEIGASNTITVYPDVGHAFVKSSTFRESGPAGDAWDQIVDFLDAEVR